MLSDLKRNGSAPPSLPLPQPKSPPRYPDLYGKRKEFAKVQMLEREIGFLEEELKSIEGLQPASRSCKEVADFVTANADPIIPTTKKSRKSCRFWKWFCGASWLCCCKWSMGRCCDCNCDFDCSFDCMACNWCSSSMCGKCRIVPKCNWLRSLSRWKCRLNWCSSCCCCCNWHCCFPRCDCNPKCPNLNVCSCNSHTCCNCHPCVCCI